MKTLHSLVLVLALTFGCRPAVAAAEEDPARVAQVFYDGYIKLLNANGDGERSVLKSDQFTPGFKKAYKAYMKDADSDPIVQGQDYPKPGFKASPAKINGASAKVTMVSRDRSFAYSIKVTLVKTGEHWQISGIGDLQGK